MSDRTITLGGLLVIVCEVLAGWLSWRALRSHDLIRLVLTAALDWLLVWGAVAFIRRALRSKGVIR